MRCKLISLHTCHQYPLNIFYHKNILYQYDLFIQMMKKRKISILILNDRNFQSLIFDNKILQSLEHIRQFETHSSIILRNYQF